jgi:hypothetical protein
MKIESVIKFFKVKPIVNGNIDNKPIEKMFSGNGWSIQRHYDSYGPKQAIAVMGNIGYPIDASQVYPSEYANYWSTKSEGLRMLLGSSILYFDIGELSIAASREELEYNNATIQAIKIAASKAWKEFHSSLQDQLNKCQDGFEARGFLWKLSKASSNAWGDITGTLKWNGKPIGTYLMDGKAEGISIDSYSYNNGHYSKAKNVTITPDEQTVKDFLLFLSDEPTGHSAKMNHIAKQNPGKSCYLFKVRKFKNEDGEDIDGMSWFEKYQFPYGKLKKLSGITVPKENNTAAARQSVTPKGSMKVYEMNSKVSSWGTQSDNWIEVVKDKKDIEYYIELDRFKIKSSDDYFHERSADTLKKFIDLVNKHVCKVPSFVGVKTSDINRLNDESVNLFDYLKTRIMENKKFNNSLISSMNKQKISSEISKRNSYLLYLDLYKKRGGFNEDSDFKKVLDLVSIVHSKEEGFVDLIDHVKQFYKIEAFAKPSDIESIVDGINSKYKLLPYIGYVYCNNYKDLSEAITEYVNLVDSK